MTPQPLPAPEPEPRPATAAALSPLQASFPIVLASRVVRYVPWPSPMHVPCSAHVQKSIARFRSARGLDYGRSIPLALIVGSALGDVRNFIRSRAAAPCAAFVFTPPAIVI